jgi:hypothetical protein
MGLTMKLVQFSIIIVFSVAGLLRAQTGSSSGSVGISPYMQPAEATYRLLFGEGGNAGLGMQSPQTSIGSLTYQIGASVLSAGFISSNPVSGGYPRRTYDEFDFMYGLAIDQILLSYGRPTNQFHASISAGISVDDYSARGHRPSVDTGKYYVPRIPPEISPGLPIQLQAVYEPFRFAGIGVILFSDFSKLQPSYGGAVVMELRY